MQYLNDNGAQCCLRVDAFFSHRFWHSDTGAQSNRAEIKVGHEKRSTSLAGRFRSCGALRWLTAVHPIKEASG